VLRTLTPQTTGSKKPIYEVAAHIFCPSAFALLGIIISSTCKQHGNDRKNSHYDHGFRE
jgi:hypothetical protein